MRTSLLLVVFVATGGLLLAPLGAEEETKPEWAQAAVTRIAVDLPVVPHAEPDTPLPPAERFVVTLTADGTLHYASADEPPALHTGHLSLEDTEANTTTLREFASHLRLATRDAALRNEDDTSKVGLLLRADRRTPWIYALWLLQTGGARDLGTYRSWFAVAPPDAARGGYWMVPHDLPRDSRIRTPDEPRIEVEKQRALVRLEVLADEGGPTKVLRLLGLVDGVPATPREELRVIPWAEPGTDALSEIAEALEARLRRARPSGRTADGLEVTIALAPSGARMFTFGDVLPILSTLQHVHARVLLQAVPSGRVPFEADAPDPTVRHPFGGRRRPSRRAERRREAVEEALRWLAAHASPNGAWEAAGFAGWCDGKPSARRPEGAGDPAHDVGVTALALLAFLGEGYTDRGDHPFTKSVSRGLRYLKNVQDQEGCFGPREDTRWVYDHALASWAMVEAYGMTKSPVLKGAAQRGLDFIALCRNPYFAWRYGVKPGDNDTSVTGCMLMPIALARIVGEQARERDEIAPLTIDEGAFDGAWRWFDKMTDTDYGRVGYIQRGSSVARPQKLVDRFPANRSEAMTALAITTRVFAGADPSRNHLIAKGLELLRRLPPTWNETSGSIDMYYWYWGALAAFQSGGRTWQTWEKAIDEAILAHQHHDTTYCLYKGSWDPVGPWGPEGGRVYSTALMAMCLQAAYRYDRRSGR